MSIYLPIYSYLLYVNVLLNITLTNTVYTVRIICIINQFPLKDFFCIFFAYYYISVVCSADYIIIRNKNY